VNLYINDEKVDFTLESEKTLSDVVRSLEQWLACEKMVIAALAINGEPLTQTDLDEKKNLAVSALREVRVSASDFLGMEVEGLRALSGFFSALRETLLTKDMDRLPGLLERYAEAESMLRFLLASSGTEQAARERGAWEKLFAGTTPAMVKLWDEPTRERAVGLCDFFLKVFAEKSEQYRTVGQSSLKLARETIAALRRMTERLGEVPVLLQTGKDNAAMQTIASFTEMAQLFIRLIGFVFTPEEARRIDIEGVDVEHYSQKLNTHLRELVEAFEKKDYILIGDLCEYEIAPKIRPLIDTVERALPASAG
jgi:hypothetical protein